jgi:hypothetical protein
VCIRKCLMLLVVGHYGGEGMEWTMIPCDDERLKDNKKGKNTTNISSVE